MPRGPRRYDAFAKQERGGLGTQKTKLKSGSPRFVLLVEVTPEDYEKKMMVNFEDCRRKILMLSEVFAKKIHQNVLQW
jgi:hypothetical protein